MLLPFPQEALHGLHRDHSVSGQASVAVLCNTKYKMAVLHHIVTMSERHNTAVRAAVWRCPLLDNREVNPFL
jgi:hypothetical protein